MLRGRSPSSGPKADAAETASKNSNGSGGVLTRVLGSLRRGPRDGDAKANNQEDTNWVNTYKITHRPDRPRHDRRESLRHRNSVYVLGQLRRIWQHNAKVSEAKRREREAKEEEKTANHELEGSSSQDQRSRDGDGHGQGGDTSSNSSSNNTGRGSRPRAPTLQTDVVPNFSWKDPSPEFAKSKWQMESEERQHQTPATDEAGKQVEQHGALAYPPPPPSSPPPPPVPSDRMIIKVGMTLQSPYHNEGSGGFKIDSGGGAESGGHNDTQTSSSTLQSAPRLLGASTTLPPPSAALFSPPAQKGAAAEMRPLSRSPLDRLEAKYIAAHQTIMQQQQQQQTPWTANAIQMLTPPARTPRPMITTPLYIKTEQDSSNSTPSLTLSSSPVSGQTGPWTPDDDDDDDDGIDSKSPPSTEPPPTPKTCPMPLCSNPLLTATDRKQNLCGRCRGELQPRPSVFTTDVLNRFSYLRSSMNAAYPTSSTSLFSDTQHEALSSAAAEVKPKKPPPPTTSRYLNGESKRTRTGTAHHRSGGGGGDQSADRVRKIGVLPPPTPRRKRSGRAKVSSRFNKDRGEFKLQPVPLGRKYSRRGQRPYPGTPSPGGLPLRNSNNNVLPTGNNHIGFQLVGYPPPDSSSQPLLHSGPLLEPKTFRPVTTTPTRRTVIVRRKPSNPRPRAKGGGATGGQQQQIASVPRGHGDKTRVHKVNSPKSPGHRRNKHHHHHQANLHHLEDRGARSHGSGAGTADIGGVPSPKEGEKVIDDEDIYREIEMIIDCYLSRPDASESENEKRKADAIASYFATVPLDVEMRLKGFI